MSSGVRYCECDSPVWDPMYDVGCRRCGLPVDLTPKRPPEPVEPTPADGPWVGQVER